MSQLNLIRLRLPSYSGTPRFIQERGDYAKGFMMGLLLGNAGVGCPNPLFYWLLIYVAGTGSAEVGAGLGVVHGFGRRSTPGSGGHTGCAGGEPGAGRVGPPPHHRGGRRLDAHSGGLVLIINAIPGGHQWYEDTIIHIWWNNMVSMLSIPPSSTWRRHTHDTHVMLPPDVVPGILAAMILTPIGWHYLKRAMQ